MAILIAVTRYFPGKCFFKHILQELCKKWSFPTYFSKMLHFFWLTGNGSFTSFGIPPRIWVSRSACHVRQAKPKTGKSLEVLFDSMDWFKGKSTGNHRFSHEIWGFPVNFPLNQSIDRWFSWPTKPPWLGSFSFRVVEVHKDVNNSTFFGHYIAYVLHRPV